jgi:uroporphyrinogen decarboxylase
MTKTVAWPAEDLRRAQTLTKETEARGGRAPVELERFWADNEIALKDPFGRQIPQCAFGATLTRECVFAELGLPEDHWKLLYDATWRAEVCKAYNDKAETIVGRRILDESLSDPALAYPEIKGLHAVFEAENVWHGNSWWLQQAAHSEDELQALLDRVESRDIRKTILPPNWDHEKTRLLQRGVKPPLYRGQRGPVTFATSIYGAEPFLYLLLDNPALAARLRDAILRAMLAIGRVLDEEAGYTPENAPRGFSFCDDNCALLTPDLYRFFAYPILKGIFERYAPATADHRFQHSDSDMGHLLPVLSELKLTGTNFGPRVMADLIRRHLPQAVIYGEMAPFTYCRNEQVNIVCEFLRDFRMVGDSRGLVFTTAGSINNGTRLTSMRLAMAAVQRYGRYASL